MDPVPGSKHQHDEAKPRTAGEEAMVRVAHALNSAQQDYQRLPMLSFGKKAYIKGVIKALTLIFGLLHELNHKYDNQHGGWN